MPFDPPDFPPEPGPLQERLTPDRILCRLGAVPELAMQAAIWRECFEHLSPDQLVIVVGTVRRALVRGEIAGRAGWLSLVRVVEQIRGGPKGLALFLAAKAAQDEALQALLLDSAPARALDADAHRPPRLNTDREISLGERRSWARRPDRHVLNRLLADPDPLVIENLLRNPKLTEADVVRLAARRPVPPEVLETVFRSRWSRRTEVQRTLVLNPYSPVDLACGLVPLLDRGAIAKVRRETNLHIAVRTTAGIILGEYDPS